tara:strand:- start:197 stop:406 length:210 start_codon:yes stop_codon:yes gene_type:complete
MDKEIETYIQSLLADRKRLLKGALKGLSEVKKGNSSIEVDFVLRQETQWELDQIVKAQRALDILTEEGI